MVDPRKDCEILLEEHAALRRVQRGLTVSDLERAVREGVWAPRTDGATDISYGVWTVRVRIGICTIGVVTLFPERG